MNVFITGATSGIGLATAIAFGREGHHVYMGYLHQDDSYDAALKQLQECAGGCTPVHLDIHDLEAISKLKQEVDKDKYSVDILVNNAGVYDEHEFLDSTPEIWDYVINTNLRGTFFVTQAFANMMQKRGNGSIVNVASVAGVYPRKNHLEYAISKAGIIHMTKCLSQTLAPVRVNAVAPSYTWSKLMSFMDDAQKVAEKTKQIPLGRFNDPEDVASAITFLASEQARNITGEVLIIDGGRMGRI